MDQGFAHQALLHVYSGVDRSPAHRSILQFEPGCTWIHQPSSPETKNAPLKTAVHTWRSYCGSFRGAGPAESHCFTVPSKGGLKAEESSLGPPQTREYLPGPRAVD